MTRVPHDEKKHHKRRALPIRYVIAFFVFLFTACCILALAYGFMIGHWYQEPMLTISKIIPVPVARVGGQIVTYNDVAELALVAEWEEKDDPFEEALNTSINRVMMRQLAYEVGTGISQEDLEAYEISQDDVEELLDAIGWDVEKYRLYIVEPLLLYQAVDEQILYSREHQTIALAEIGSIIENIELGVSFTDLAVQYSEHESYVLGGDLGYVEREDFSQGMESIFDMEIGEITEVLEWGEYFVVATVYDVIDGEDDRSMVGVQMIAIEKDNLSVIFEQYKKGVDVKMLIR